MNQQYIASQQCPPKRREHLEAHHVNIFFNQDFHNLQFSIWKADISDGNFVHQPVSSR